MSDRPNLNELLDAVRLHVETSLLPVIRSEPRLYFQTLITLNMLKIAQRELAVGSQMRRVEWEGLNQLTENTEVAPERDSELTDALTTRYRILQQSIRNGDYDHQNAFTRLAAFLEPVVNAQLMLNNPSLARRIGDEIRGGYYAE